MPLPPLITVLEKNKKFFHPVVPASLGMDKLIRFDFTADNIELNDVLINSIENFTGWVNNKLMNAGARYGVGGYAELRVLYSYSRIFDGPPGEEPRRFHLGTDIWGKPNTAVMAPLDGLVHSFAFNNAKGDYGATVILSHHLEHVSFYTLYGHLSLSSIKNLHEGQHVYAGEVFAEFGIPAENGQWPPHLHFQIIQNLDGWKGDYPGVCKLSEKDDWLSNCPDPDLILQLNQYLME